MLTQNAVIELVRRYVCEIEMQNVVLRTAILFGSFAKGVQHEWSDIDVALVADSFTGLGIADRQRFIAVAAKPLYVRIEARTYSTPYFRQGDPLIYEIKQSGILIMAK